MALPQAELFKLESTRGDMVIPVDYNDAGAVDPGPDDILWSQLAVDQILTREGATSFKHVNAVLNAIPYFVDHNITINMAAGIHRPRPEDALGYSGAHVGIFKSIKGILTFQGAAPSEWNEVDASLVDLPIDSFQTGSGDPWLDFSSTNPGVFAGFDLKGAAVVLSTGQTVFIHDHTDDRLYVLEEISPSPSGQTATVAFPSTILKNADVGDVSYVCWYDVKIESQNRGDVLNSYQHVLFNDMMLQKFGNYNCITVRETACGFQRFVIDGKTFDSNGSALEISGSFYSAFAGSILGKTPAFDPQDEAIWADEGTLLYIVRSYICGWENGIAVREGSNLLFYGSVMDSVTRASVGQLIWGDASVMVIGGKVAFVEYGGSKYCEIRNSRIDVAGVSFHGGEGRTRFYISNQVNYAYPNRIIFKNLQGPCVRIGDGVSLQLVPNLVNSVNDQKWEDGGGNTKVGWEFVGLGASLRMGGSYFSATGALGDVRTKGGDVWSYADILTDGPITDLGLNVVSKES